VITFNNQATTGYDTEFDSQFLPGYAPQFYSVAGEVNLSTNVLPGFDSQATVPFNFIKTDGTNYSIEAVQIDNVPDQVYLTDLKTNQSQNLTQNPLYSFTALAGDESARFLLSFHTLGVQTPSGENCVIYVNNNTLNISNPGKSLIEVYNILGQKIADEQTDNETLAQITLKSVTGYYIVKVTTGQKVVAKKIFIN
jgi:hypothetical protein